jgi:hypothetical protein
MVARGASQPERLAIASFVITDAALGRGAIAGKNERFWHARA